MNTNQQIDHIARQIEAEVEGNDYHNYSSEMYDDSALGYSADDSVLDYSNANMTKKVVGLSTYNVNITYVDGGGGLPVEVELFGTNFNNGVIVGQTLVFTNATGDTATVTGITSPFTAFQDRLRSAPFRVRYFRETVIDAAQFREQFTFRMDSVYGGFKGNTLDPQEFITPEQFQLLRVDVPVNSSFDSERRLIFNVGPTEVAPGMQIAFWVDAIDAPIRNLTGKPSAIQMTGEGLQANNPTESTRANVNSIAKVQMQNTKAMSKLINVLAASKGRR